MELKTISGKYLAPEVEVIEIKSQEVLCLSGIFDTDDEYTEGIFSW